MTKLRWVSAAVLLLALPAFVMAQGKASIYEIAAPPAPAGQLDRIVFAKLSSLGFRPVLCSDAVFRPPCLPRSDRHAAHRARGQGVHSRSRRRNKRAALDRSPAGASGIRRLLGDEMGRRTADQGGVPHQPLAQRGPGVSPLGAGIARREQALRPVRPRVADLQRQQFSRRPGEFLPSHPEPDPGRHRRGRGADVHGHARRFLAGQTE